MDWTSPLRSQQTSFITRLTYVLSERATPDDGLTGLLEAAFRPETPVLPLQIEQLTFGSTTASALRAASRNLILESDPSLSVRELLRSYLREQLLQLTLSTTIGACVCAKQTADYLDLDRLGLFELNLAAIHECDLDDSAANPLADLQVQPLRLRVLWLEGDHSIEDLAWSQAPESDEVGLVVCLWIREPITEVCNRYHVVLAGFLPGAALNGHDHAAIAVHDLLYMGGLSCYLDALAKKIHRNQPRTNWFQTLTTASNYVYPFAIGADGRTIASSSYDGSLRIWTTDNTELIASLAGQVRSIVPSSAFSGSHPLSSDTAEKQLKLSQSGSAVLSRHLIGHPSGISAVTLSPSSHFAVSGCDDGSISVWDIRTGETCHRLQAHRTSVKALIMSKDETLLVSSATDRSLKVWDLPSGNLRFDLKPVGDVTISLVIDDQERFLISGTQSGQIQIWDLTDGSLRREIAAHAGVVQALTIDPDGTQIASASTERTIKVWDLETGKSKETLTGHPTPLIALAPQSGSRWVDLSLFQHQQPGWRRSNS
ncbi:MAG: WD40 repeat domain-containing protein [Coleofasciculaceae cyanobacterium RL_1_1]|nr:WD40 repeat domain-containing protein [Coleofasciculaceae cyanobacterium RL_1_1]